MVELPLRELWGNLQGKKIHFPHFLSAVTIDGLRGIGPLRIPLDYPVTVIAGGNGSGKTTVLFAAACAYRVPGAGTKTFVPSTLFPDYRPSFPGRADARNEVSLEFEYATPNGHRSMRWRRAKGWNRSFFGRKGAVQPSRHVYLRTLSNLSNPAEVRGVLSLDMLRKQPVEDALNASQITLAHRILPFRYSHVVRLSSGRKNLLFAEQNLGPKYSELHMAAGERAILRIAQDVGQVTDALVLIDEVEASIHPWLQELLMIELQQLALRNNLQVIVTTHSPVVLDTVPANGRIFLDRARESGTVSMQTAYRDVVQHALYGRANESLNILCEDEAAEGVLLGVFDVVLRRQYMRNDIIHIGRDTGADEFPAHAKAFTKFGRIRNFVFVLDGDQAEGNIQRRIEEAGAGATVVFLPGKGSPEQWVWQRLEQDPDLVAKPLGMGTRALQDRIQQLNSTYDSASDSDAVIAKEKLYMLAEEAHWQTRDVCRLVAREESGRRGSDIQPLVETSENALIIWRARFEPG